LQQGGIGEEIYKVLYENLQYAHCLDRGLYIGKYPFPLRECGNICRCHLGGKYDGVKKKEENVKEKDEKTKGKLKLKG
jgi:hypothetical protein